MRINVLFYGIHRFADFTNRKLIESLSNYAEVRIFSHTWSSDNGISAPWLDRTKLEISSREEFKALWPNSNLVIESDIGVLHQTALDELDSYSTFSGYGSRAGVLRMITSIGKVCELALAQVTDFNEITVLTRTDLMTFDRLPDFIGSQVKGLVWYPNLRRNREFCDWFMVLDVSALKILAALPPRLHEVIIELKSFAGEDILRHVLTQSGFCLRPFSWSGILVRDKELSNLNFGRLPFKKPFRARRLKQFVSFVVQNAADACVGFISSLRN